MKTNQSTKYDPQQKWTENFNFIAEMDQDEMLIDDNIENDFDKNEWTY